MYLDDDVGTVNDLDACELIYITLCDSMEYVLNRGESTVTYTVSQESLPIKVRSTCGSEIAATFLR